VFGVAALPASLLFVFLILPVLVMVAFSFFTEIPSSILSPPELTLENYRTILLTDRYWGTLIQTTAIAIQATATIIVVGYLLAYSIVRFSKRAMLLLLLVILPYWANFVVRMYAWVNILQQGGLVDTVLTSLNIIQSPLGLLYGYEAMMIGFIYAFLPLAVLPFYASLNELDPALVDAAQDLGAGPIDAFLSVTLPMTLRGVLFGVVLVAIPVYGSFIVPQILGGPGNSMLGNVIESQFNQAFNWPLGAAMGVILTVAVVTALTTTYWVTTNFLPGDQA
jgi:spermidine/putrescine transport system permease protein